MDGVFSPRSGGSSHIAVEGSLDDFQRDEIEVVGMDQVWLPRTGIVINSSFWGLVTVQKELFEATVMSWPPTLQAVRTYGTGVLLPFKNDNSILVEYGVLASVDLW
jgi:hypothetical protein